MTFIGKSSLLLALYLMTSGAQAKEKISHMLKALEGLNLSSFEFSIQKVTEEKAKDFCSLVKTEPLFSCQLQTEETIKNSKNVTATISLKAKPTGIFKIEDNREKLTEITNKVQAFTENEKPGGNLSVKFTAKSSN